MTDNCELEDEIKRLIVEVLALEDVRPEEIDAEDQLFANSLGLDSIDALEISMAIEARYGVTFQGDPDQNESIFASVRTLAAFVAEARQPVD
ncbi:MAG: acyl carrier protein [Deltaproteobacteria bacterium]|nr:acyl carrier protein [Deltaproteobacteria bacterium]